MERNHFPPSPQPSPLRVLVCELELFPQGEAVVEIPKPENVKEPPPGTTRFQERVVFAASLVLA